MIKYLITLLIALSSFVVKAQINSDKLIGTWELSEYTYIDNKVVPHINGFKRFKMYTATHFAVIEVNIKTSEITTSIMGTYTLLDSNYTERIVFSSRPNVVMIGSYYLAKVSFDNEDSMAMVVKAKVVIMDERWKKVKIDPFKAIDQ